LRVESFSNRMGVNESGIPLLSKAGSAYLRRVAVGVLDLDPATSYCSTIIDLCGESTAPPSVAPALCGFDGSRCGVRPVDPQCTQDPDARGIDAIIAKFLANQKRE